MIFLDDVVPAIASLLWIGSRKHRNRFRQDDGNVFRDESFPEFQADAISLMSKSRATAVALRVPPAGWFPLPDAVAEAFGLPPICTSYSVLLSLEQLWASTDCGHANCRGRLKS